MTCSSLKGRVFANLVIPVDTPYGLLESMEDHLPPQFFPYSPWERAYKYIQQFPAQPPDKIIL